MSCLNSFAQRLIWKDNNLTIVFLWFLFILDDSDIRVCKKLIVVEGEKKGQERAVGGSQVSPHYVLDFNTQFFFMFNVFILSLIGGRRVCLNNALT